MPKTHPLLAQAPLLIGTISTPECLKAAAKLAPTPAIPRPDLLELRLDSLLTSPQSPFPEIPANSPPLLLTYRAHSQGGAPTSANKSAAERAEILTSLLPHAAAIDFEWSELAAAKKAAETLFTQAQERQILRIASEHHFKSCPSQDYLEDLIAQVANAPEPLRPDLLKIAVHLQSPSELARLLHLLESPPIPLALMGMGPLGAASRLALSAAGSKLLYGYLHQPNAPGQLSITQLHALEELWKPSATQEVQLDA